MYAEQPGDNRLHPQSQLLRTCAVRQVAGSHGRDSNRIPQTRIGFGYVDDALRRWREELDRMVVRSLRETESRRFGRRQNHPERIRIPAAKKYD